MSKHSVTLKFFSSLLSLALLWSLAAASSAASKLPEVSPEGLKLAQNTKAYAVYLQEGADVSSYDRVMLLECHVAFRKNWQRDQSFRVSDSDMIKIKDKLAKEFKTVYSQSLADKGLQMVEEAGSGVLVLRPAIINLDVVAPDVMQAGMSRTFSTSAGSMTLFLEVFDGVTGDLLARVIDPQKARDYGSMRVRSGVTNKADADRIIKKWADTLGDYLLQARTSSSSLGTP